MDDPLGDRLRWVSRHAEAARKQAVAANLRADSAAREARKRMKHLDEIGRRVQTLADQRR